MSIFKLLLVVGIVFAAACAHSGLSAGNRPPAVKMGIDGLSAAAQGGQPRNGRSAAEYAAANQTGSGDDFIEVDDSRGFSKSWPMALFMGLIGVAIGAL